MFKVFGENKLTLDEVAESTKISKELLMMILSNEANIVTDISRLLKFTGFRFSLRKYRMKTHVLKATEDNDVVMICRVVEPKCNISYDKKLDQYFNLNFRSKRTEKKLSENRRQQVIADFVNYKKTRIDRNYVTLSNLR